MFGFESPRFGTEGPVPRCFQSQSVSGWSTRPLLTLRGRPEVKPASASGPQEAPCTGGGQEVVGGDPKLHPKLLANSC